MQIRLQAEGPLAFDRPEVLGRLNLSPEQVELIQQLVAAGRRRIEVASSVQIGSVGPGESPRQVRGSPELYKSEQYKAWRKSSLDRTLAARDETTQAIVKLLTKGQRATFRKMLGEPFDLAKLRDNGPTFPEGDAKRDEPSEDAPKSVPR